MSTPGRAPTSGPGSDGDQTGENTCPACAGTGSHADRPCDGCGGTGVVTELVGDA